MAKTGLFGKKKGAALAVPKPMDSQKETKKDVVEQDTTPDAKVPEADDKQQVINDIANSTYAAIKAAELSNSRVSAESLMAIADSIARTEKLHQESLSILREIRDAARGD